MLENILNTIIATVSASDKVQLVGFSAFESKKRDVRTGSNPKTTGTVEIPATMVPVFKDDKEFKDAVKS